ncbi:Helix-turn-helix [Mycobacteroides abscessus subsp. bolletii]|uniref:helix-turn-helix domain-containing protein n=2 Tax=Mycobacteroides abscessus TaxID=36809 RepID=UPI0009CDF56F|nr:helix-turn-helix transcriptional regulator [Mycobacteroides abscessus]SKZ01094.1 Helix-turn-helix [Mycobacteroides abscessus subsp. bolletii]
MTTPQLADLSTTRARVAGEVRAFMGRADVNQAQLSRATGITQPTLSRKLKARDERDAFDVEELAKIAAVFGISITELFPAASTVKSATGGRYLTAYYGSTIGKRAGHRPFLGGNHGLRSRKLLSCNNCRTKIT